MVTYETKSGDTFDIIAYEKFGNCKYAADLMNVNRDKLQYFIFPAGIELNLPEISTDETNFKLPAWYSK